MYSYASSSDIRYDNRSYAIAVWQKSRVKPQILAPSCSKQCLCPSITIYVFQVVKSPHSHETIATATVFTLECYKSQAQREACEDGQISSACSSKTHGTISDSLQDLLTPQIKVDTVTLPQGLVTPKYIQYAIYTSDTIHQTVLIVA